MYDTVAQYDQLLSGEVSDWHPPIMVRLWQLLHHVASGPAPMFVVQTALYALGAGLVVGALVREGRRLAATAAALILASPLLLGWQMVVLKDCQMQAALIAAVGIACHYRLGGRRIPLPAALILLVLIAYATLVRTNGIFATAPLGLLLLRWPNSITTRALLIPLVALVSLAGAPFINHRLLGARASDIAKSQPIFDLAAIDVQSPGSARAFTRNEIAKIRGRHCVKAFFWDPLGDPTACAPVTERLISGDAEHLYLLLGQAVLSHPLVYARHRLEHWNSTERWLVRAGLPQAVPPIEPEPNDLGIGTRPKASAALWQKAAAVEAATPIGWPIVWTCVALCLFPIAWRSRSTSAGNVALALLSSALLLEFSFLVVSIASDLRYHLWPMSAAALALVLLSDQLDPKRRGFWVGFAFLLAVCAGGVVTRWQLPRAPDSYQGMIHAAFG